MGYIESNATGRSKIRFKLVELLFSPVLRWTDCPVDIEWGGYTWKARGLLVSTITNPDAGPTMSFSVPDADKSFYPILRASNGGQSVIVNAWVAEFSPTSASAAPDDVAKIFTGRITAAKKTTQGENRVDVTCGPPAMTTGINFPTRMISNLIRLAV